MPKPTQPDHIAPAGEHVRREVLIRVTTPDGRISDHGPYIAPLSGAMVEFALTFRCPPGATTTRLYRTVTTTATDWAPAEDAPDA